MDAFERRDSLRRYAPIHLTPPDGSRPVTAKGIVSLRGIFLEGKDALPLLWENALVGVEAGLGGAQPLRAICLVTRPDERKDAGFFLTWKTIDFDNERELARYLDEK